MWTVLLFVVLSISPAWCQRSSRQDDDLNALDIKLSVPGKPGNDYPTLGLIPRTSFSCAGKTPGYYGDMETNCQVFRVCTLGSTYGFQSFLCPNGTLFNQAVFVCDWWMNVNCASTKQHFSSNKDKFSNLKLGPQFMSDVKKMITHPMRHPYDKTALKSNQVLMQEYKPPSGQLSLPKSSPQLAGSKKAQQTDYNPAKIQQNRNKISDNLVAGSTAGPRFAAPDFGSFQRATQFTNAAQNGYNYNAKLIQGSTLQVPERQYIQSNNLQNSPQNGQYRAQNSQSSGNIISNGQAGRLVPGNSEFPLNYMHAVQQQRNYQYSQQYNQNPNSQRQNIAQYSGNVAPVQQFNTPKHAEFGVSFARQQINPNQDKQPYTYNAPIQFSNQVKGQVGTEAKQNLVSPNGPNVITKKITFNRIVQPKPGGPKSRIVFKTWVSKPGKSAKLIAQPTPYSYERPTLPTIPAKIISDSTPYFYVKPTVAAKQITDDGYAYEKPQKQVTQPDQGYAYERPTTPEKQVEIIRATPRPFTTNPTKPPRLYLAVTSPPSTSPPRLYLAPTTFKPLVNLYLPPSVAPTEASRLYLGPNDNDQSAKLQASPTSPRPMFAAPPGGLFSLIKHSRINTNHNNLTFTDILTKEKLDITVNDIVKDTSKILGTASSPQSGQLRQADSLDDYPDENYLPPEEAQNIHESSEIITPSTSPVLSGALKSARVVAQPAATLIPPDDSTEGLIQSKNRLSNLPFIQPPTVTPTNTIERTVSFKISIPEKTAAYLFQKSNDSDFDRLEILNTGSSNYLVLSNKIKQNPVPSFIPIGKIILDKDSNLSDSQALVFSFLADSLNQVKGYNTIAEQNIVKNTPSQTQYDNNVNSEELAQITNQVAQLTSAQYNNNNNGNLINANIAHTNQNVNNRNQQQTARYTSGLTNDHQQHSAQNQASLQPNYYSAKYPTNNNAQYNRENQIYSGQLYQIPVPDVTGIYNGQNSAKLITPTNVEQHLEVADLQQGHHQNNAQTQSSGEVEFIQSHSLPVGGAPARLQAAPTQETLIHGDEDHTHDINNFIHNGNGIHAQIRDKIVGTINHPSDDSKVLSYNKDQSYYLFTTLNNLKSHPTYGNIHGNQQSARLTQGSNNQDNIVFQFLPSVGYELDDEKEKQKILNAFNINEFGSPKSDVGRVSNQAGTNILTSNVDYTVQHGQSQQYNAPSTLYKGPSSYSAPQSSVGRLESNNAAKLELEQFDENSGYAKSAPTKTFTF